MEIGINIQPYLPKDSVNILFSMKDLSTHEKKIAAAKLHRQYCHPPFALLKKKSDVCPVEKDDEFLNILEKYLNCSSVCKRFKPTLPKPAVGYVFDLDKMKFNQVVSIDFKQYKNKWIIYLYLSIYYTTDVATRCTRADFAENV